MGSRLRKHLTGGSYLNPDCSWHKLVWHANLRTANTCAERFLFVVIFTAIAAKFFAGILKYFRKGEIKNRQREWGEGEIKSDRGMGKKKPRLLILCCRGISDSLYSDVNLCSLYCTAHKVKALSFMHSRTPSLSIHFSLRSTFPFYSLLTPPPLFSPTGASLLSGWGVVSLGWGPAGLNGSLHSEGLKSRLHRERKEAETGRKGRRGETINNACWEAMLGCLTYIQLYAM